MTRNVKRQKYESGNPIGLSNRDQARRFLLKLWKSEQDSMA